jgi:hypothetical protein
MFQTKVAEKIETDILRPVTPPPENRALYATMWKYGRARQATDDNVMCEEKMRFEFDR